MFDGGPKNYSYATATKFTDRLKNVNVYYQRLLTFVIFFIINAFISVYYYFFGRLIHLWPAVSPVDGNLTTPTVAGLPGLCENVRLQTLAQFHIPAEFRLGY